MARNEALEWMKIATATMTLGWESAGVVGLRAAKAIRSGPYAADELWRMYSEKFIALAELQARLLVGTLGTTPSSVATGSIKHYRRKVVANRRRLSRY